MKGELLVFQGRGVMGGGGGAAGGIREAKIVGEGECALTGSQDIQLS